MTARVMLLVAVFGCGSPAAPEPAAPTHEAAPDAAAPVTFERFTGTWVTEKGDATETWVAVGDAFIGAGFGVSEGKTVLFEALIVHRSDGEWVYTAMPNGRKMVDFSGTFAADGITFSNLGHDHPKKISYAGGGDALTVTLQGDEGESTFRMRRGKPAPSAELEMADRVFDEDCADRGGAAWAARFDEGGVSWPVGAPKTTGPKAVKEHIDSIIASGVDLRWSPTASGLSPAGDMGFTTGGYRVVNRDSGSVVGTGAYLTVWEKTEDNGWIVRFDSGVSAAKK